MRKDLNAHGTTARPVTVGPHIRTRGFFWLTNALAECLTTLWTVKAGSAIEATPWKIARLDAYSPRRDVSEKLAASSGVGPAFLALYVSNETSPIRSAWGRYGNGEMGQPDGMRGGGQGRRGRGAQSTKETHRPTKLRTDWPSNESLRQLQSSTAVR